MIRTRLTELLQIEHPVMLAGMGGVSYHKLVAAVSEAGGFGSFGAATMSTEQMVGEIHELKKLTVEAVRCRPPHCRRRYDRAMHGRDRRRRDGVHRRTRRSGEHRRPLPSPRRPRHQHVRQGIHARPAVEAGCDIVVAQGTEAGGHTGKVATLPLVPQIVDAVGGKVPVVAAGGIFDGRGLAAALILGADGVWVGTPSSRRLRLARRPATRTRSSRPRRTRRSSPVRSPARRCARSRTPTRSTSRSTRTSSSDSRNRWSVRRKTRRCTSAATTCPTASTRTRSVTRPDKASARSTSSSRPASSSGGSWRRRKRRWSRARARSLGRPSPALVVRSARRPAPTRRRTRRRHRASDRRTRR